MLPAIAETNRVCAYDRPGTILATGEGAEDFLPSRSDPVDQPTTLQDHVDDLHALLKASGERGPYVVVGHSMGGAVSRLYASEYPEDVSGLVLVDPTPFEAANALTAEQWALWKPLLGGPPSGGGSGSLPRSWSGPTMIKTSQQASAAAPLKPMPFIAFQSDVPFDLTPYVEDGTLPMTARGGGAVPPVAL